MFDASLGEGEGAIDVDCRGPPSPFCRAGVLGGRSPLYLICCLGTHGGWGGVFAQSRHVLLEGSLSPMSTGACPVCGRADPPPRLSVWSLDTRQASGEMKSNPLTPSSSLRRQSSTPYFSLGTPLFSPPAGVTWITLGASCAVDGYLCGHADPPCTQPFSLGTPPRGTEPPRLFPLPTPSSRRICS